MNANVSKAEIVKALKLSGQMPDGCQEIVIRIDGSPKVKIDFYCELTKESDKAVSNVINTERGGNKGQETDIGKSADDRMAGFVIFEGGSGGYIRCECGHHLEWRDVREYNVCLGCKKIIHIQPDKGQDAPTGNPYCTM